MKNQLYELWQLSTFTQHPANPHEIEENKEVSFAVQTHGVRIAKDTSLGGVGGIRFRCGESHGGCDMPPACRQEPPFESLPTNKNAPVRWTGVFLWRSGRDSNPRAAQHGHTISSRARYDRFDTTPCDNCFCHYQNSFIIIHNLQVFVKLFLAVFQKDLLCGSCCGIIGTVNSVSRFVSLLFKNRFFRCHNFFIIG